MTRIIIAGSRNFSDYNFLKQSVVEKIKYLKSLGYNISRDNIEILSGKASGADTLGEWFADEAKLKIIEFPANWNIGKQAGYVRNNDMAEYSIKDGSIGVLLAFWDKKSKGTKHMIDLAKNMDWWYLYSTL